MRIAIMLLLVLGVTVSGQDALGPVGADEVEGNYEITGYFKAEDNSFQIGFVHLLCDLQLQRERIVGKYNGEDVSGDWGSILGSIVLDIHPKESELFFLGIATSEDNGPVIRGHWSTVEETGAFEGRKYNGNCE